MPLIEMTVLWNHKRDGHKDAQLDYQKTNRFLFDNENKSDYNSN
jgi:hypothetical protein